MHLLKIAVAATLLVTPAQAVQCISVADDVAGLAVDVPATDQAVRDRMLQAAAWLHIAMGDVAFAGRLVSETLAPAEKSDFGAKLLEFRDIVWLRGPKVGTKEPKLNVLGIYQCEPCVTKLVTRPLAQGTISDLTVWIPTWTTPQQRNAARRLFGRIVELEFGLCGPMRAWVGNIELQVEIEKQLNQLRKNAERAGTGKER